MPPQDPGPSQVNSSLLLWHSLWVCCLDLQRLHQPWSQDGWILGPAGVPGRDPDLELLEALLGRMAEGVLSLLLVDEPADGGLDLGLASRLPDCFSPANNNDSPCCSTESAIRHFSARGRVAFMPGLDFASLTSCSSLSWTSTNRAQEGRRRLVGGSAGLLLGKLKTASTPWRSLASSPFADFICLRISLATSGVQRWR